MATFSATPSSLAKVLDELAVKVVTYRARSINEQATKNAIISPVLNQLGWDIHDLDMVTPEWRPSMPGFRGNPVDYARLTVPGRWRWLKPKRSANGSTCMRAKQRPTPRRPAWSGRS